MTKQQDWKRITHIRGIIKDRQTKITKDKNGNKRGGILLNDETIKPYVEELKALEAKMAKDKEKMTTNERVDDAAEDVKANNDANTTELKAHIDAQFEKLNPKKFKNQINKWAYIQAKGSADYYKTPNGRYMKRIGDIPPGCIFTHKIRVQEKIDDELDMYKYFHEDGTAGSAIGWDSFDFITLVGKGVELTSDAPVRLQKYAGVEGIIMSEPVVKIPKDTDTFIIEFSGSRPFKVRRQFLKFLDEDEEEEADEEKKADEEEKDQHKSIATSSTGCPESVDTPPAEQAKTSSSYSSYTSDDAEDVAPMIEEVEDENQTKDSDVPPAPVHSNAEDNNQKEPEIRICKERSAMWKPVRVTYKNLLEIGDMLDVIEDMLSKSLQRLPPCTEEYAIKRITQDVNTRLLGYETTLKAYPIMHDGHHCIRVSSILDEYDHTGPTEIRGIVFGLVEA